MKTARTLHHVLLGLSLSLIFAGCGSSDKKPEEKLVEKAKAEEGAAAGTGGAEDMKLKVAADPGEEARPAATAPASWTYEGVLGPANWGSITPAYALCEKGERQSPIDLKWKRPSGTKNLRFAFQETELRVGNNGRFVEALPAPGQTAEIDGVPFELKAIQFHTPSEHQFSGREFPAEMAFVLRDSEGRQAIVSAMLTPGKANAALNRILPNIPTEKGKQVLVQGQKYHPLALLPVNYNHYRYIGSQSIPPCTEGVLRVVMNTAVEASTDQIAQLRSHYFGNRRPLQDINKHQVEVYFGQ